MFGALFGQQVHGTLQPSIPTSMDQSGNASVREEVNKKYAKIQDGLETSISLEGRSRITRILNEVHNLTDGEKLLLYFKLPSGKVRDDQNRLTPTSNLPTSNRKEQIEASTWIKSHLEEHGDVCLPKSDVYDEYRQYCEQHELRPLCNADFGKMMKQVFPDINTRRLGQRGQSRYFYGGLRKRLEHPPPTLPELEIASKDIEMDSTTIDTEIFKSSCQLICEWAEKLLEMKFGCVQDMAEHLILKTFVNTKSVAALTLIAAMQESGKYNIKNSSVFGGQTNTYGDKHRETNLLLARKLQQNKEIQKQKEKAQALREELQQTSQGISVSTSGSKTLVTINRKSTTPSSNVVSLSVSSSASSNVPSSFSSPLPSQSPQKFQTPKKPVSPWQPQKNSENKSQSKIKEPVQNYKSNEKNTAQSKIVLNNKVAVEENIINVNEILESEIATKNSVNNQLILNLNMKDVNFVSAQSMETNDDENVENMRNANTPEVTMDTGQMEFSHVRKIDFDRLGGNDSSPENEKEGTLNCNINNTDDKLSKSAGSLNLKTMIESKDDRKSISLNKSMGFIECSKSGLFVNQSTIPGRSAFVPFSQVQSFGKKDNTNTSHSVAMAIPVIMPSVAHTSSSQALSQTSGIAMIAIPTEVNSSPVKNSKDFFQNETVFNLIPSSSLYKPQTSQTSDVMFSTSATNSTLPLFSIPSQTSVVTVSSVLSKMTSSECVTSNAQNSHKQMRMKFTPIRPKASPSKSQPQKESIQKTELPAYDKDKRPVSAILKEKRAKEHAEAIAKTVRLSSIPLQPNMSLSGTHLSTLQAIQTGPGNTPSNEVVIIVNNQPMKVQQIIGQGSVLKNATVVTKMSSDAVTSSLTPTTGNSPITSQSTTYLSATKMKTKLSSVSSDTSLTDEIDVKEIDLFECASSDVKELSPLDEECGITPITRDEDTVLVSDGDFDSNMNTNAAITDKTGCQASRMSTIMSPGSVDRMWLETPRKIQKLNITSPFQEECSYGRDTPIRISKLSDSSSSRPESACSYGRETPSGARKRKSSDFHPRCNIKRLNSTGEDSDDFHNLSLVLSPDNDFHTVINPRRTQSCTDELDKDAKVKRGHQRQTQHQLQLQKSNGDTLLPGLQSPDIHSLEREALIESFPNSLFAMKPNHKLHKNQSSSVGVNAKSLRQSQQKLIRQQQYLDERVKNFFQTKSEIPEATAPDNKEVDISQDENNTETNQMSNQIENTRNRTKFENMVVTDRGKPYQRPSSVATMSRNHSSDMDTTELPSDVAEWINEIMEERQKLNQSAMSEPDYRKEINVKANRQSIIQKFSFDMESESSHSPTVVNSNISMAKISSESISKNPKQSIDDDNNFTVPKVPPVMNLRVKESGRVSLDISSSNTRCQSLPIFASPVQSPVSPMTLSTLVPRNLGNRATSMSPRGQISEASVGVLSPTNMTLSSIKRKENRDGIICSGLTGLVHRDSKQGTYLASIQHSLQKPVDNPNDSVSPLDTSLSQVPTSSAILSSKAQAMVHHRSRESSLDMDDRFVSQTPFSDSGYHSSGPSPILNSTPVSAVDSSEHSYPGSSGLNSLKHTVAESPITMVAGNASPLTQQALNRPQLINQQVVSMTTSQANSIGGNPNQLRSSIHSAFIPIQGSNNIRYVSPIKPLVTVPNSQDLNSVTDNISDICNLYADPNQGIVSSDMTMVSPHSTDPPSYEVAIKQLKKTSPPKSAVSVQNDVSNTYIEIDGQNLKDQSIQFAAHSSVVFGNVGKQLDVGRPYSQKLIELSRQTLGVDSDQINNVLNNGSIGANKDPLSLSNMFMIVDQPQQAPSTYEINQSDSSTVGIEQNGANTSYDFTTDQITHSNNINGLNTVFSEHELSINVDGGSMAMQNSRTSVLNIDPSYQSNQPFDLNNQSETVLPRMQQLSSKRSSSESLPIYKNSFQKSDISMFSHTGSQNDDVNIFPSNSSYDNNGCADNSKNVLIAGKLNSPGYDMMLEGADSKIGETLNQNSQDAMDDMPFPWESFDEIGRDLGDFNMF